MKNIVLSILLMSACAMIYAQADSSPYQAIVAVDGSGDYKTVQEAINAVPDGQTKPWLILIKNGLYNEQVIIPKNKGRACRRRRQRMPVRPAQLVYLQRREDIVDDVL